MAQALNKAVEIERKSNGSTWECIDPENTARIDGSKSDLKNWF